MSILKCALYSFWQCTWGILQTFLGFIFFLINIKCRHYIYNGAVVTDWNTNGTSMSLGLFVFMSDETHFHKKDEEAYKKTLVHEYGHTIQSLLLGPLYLIVIGIPSSVWAMAPYFVRMRIEKKISYFSLYTERWANRWGEKCTHEHSPGMAIIN